jgi:hypothetical protein
VWSDLVYFTEYGESLGCYGVVGDRFETADIRLKGLRNVVNYNALDKAEAGTVADYWAQ